MGSAEFPKSFNPNNVEIVAFGVIITGFAKDTFCTIDANEDDVEAMVGADGSLVYVDHNNTLVIVTITLLQTSYSNKPLSLAADDKLVGAVSVVDFNGDSEFLASRSRIARKPKADFGLTPSPREWKFLCAISSPVQNTVGSTYA